MVGNFISVLIVLSIFIPCFVITCILYETVPSLKVNQKGFSVFGSKQVKLKK